MKADAPNNGLVLNKKGETDVDVYIQQAYRLRAEAVNQLSLQLGKAINNKVQRLVSVFHKTKRA